MNFWMRGAAALIAALSLAASAQAADWKFYGSARIETMYTTTDNGAGTETKNFNLSQQSNARIGAKVKVSDELAGRFEYGASGGNANVRQLWGEWNFGPGKLLVGQTYTPIYTGYSSSVYDSGAALEGYGTISASRKPMLRLGFGGFKIAAVSPSTDTLGVGGATAEVKIPKFEASYEFKWNNMGLKVLGGYNAYKLKSGAIEYDVDAYVLGLGGDLKVGPAFFKASVFTGQNLGTYGFKTTVDMDPVVNGSTLADNENMGFVLVAGYTLNDMVKFEAGYGQIYGERDLSTMQKDDASQAYVQAKITLAPGVYVVPEIGKRDEKQSRTGADEGDVTYFGAKWQINF